MDDTLTCIHWTEDVIHHCPVKAHSGGMMLFINCCSTLCPQKVYLTKADQFLAQEVSLISQNFFSKLKHHSANSSVHQKGQAGKTISHFWIKKMLLSNISVSLCNLITHGTSATQTEVLVSF